MGQPTEEQIVKYAWIFKTYPEAHCCLIRTPIPWVSFEEWKKDPKAADEKTKKTLSEWYVFGFRTGRCLIGYSRISERDAWDNATANFEKGNIAGIKYPS